MAAGLLWILDVGNNTAMEPYRAFIADTLDEEQQPIGFQAQSFFTGFGQFLAYISLFLFPIVFVGYTGSLPTWIYASFFLGAILSVTSIWWSMGKTKEIPPTAEELAILKAEPLNVFSPFIDIYKAVLEMPTVMWQLFLVYLFQWYALSASCHQSEYLAGERTFGLVSETGNHKEDHCGVSYSDRYFLWHRIYAVGECLNLFHSLFLK